jgi:glutaredoxin
MHSQESDGSVDTTDVAESNTSIATVDFAGNIQAIDVDSLSGKSVRSKPGDVDKSKRSRTAGSSTQQDVESQVSSTRQENTATVTTVTDLDCYEGRSLEQKVDSFIRAHPVVMFNKTWCLFSVDARQFLIEQMKVSLHAIEVDIHPRGKAILKYVQAKTGHTTVPIIFVRGTFLGGFEDVNQLYATGQLQNDYLKGLSQADRCEEFLAKSNIAIEPLFWFPVTVNAHVVRVTGCITSICSLVSAVAAQWVDWGQYLAYALFLDFVLRLLGGSRFSPVGQVVTLCTRCLEPKKRHGRPKQFATMCGVMFSGLGALCFILNTERSKYAGSAFMGGLAIASGMEGFLDFCVGCVMFKYGMKLGLIPK